MESAPQDGDASRFLAGIVGHDGVRRRMLRGLRAGRLAGTFLLHGDAGRGKRTLAVELAAALLCPRGPLACEPPCGACVRARRGQHPDLEIRSRGPEEAVLRIDAVRTLRAAFTRPPLEGPRRVAIIDDAETLNEEATNALLKLLEEPPPSGVLFLVSANAAALPATILSRCRRIHVPALPEDGVSEVLRRVGREDLLPFAVLADGAPGRLIRLLESRKPESRLALAVDIVDPAVDAVETARRIEREAREGARKLEGAREGLRILIELALASVRAALRARLGLLAPLHGPVSRLSELPEDILHAALHRLLSAARNADHSLGVPLLAEALCQRLRTRDTDLRTA